MTTDGRSGGRPDRWHAERALPWLAGALALLSASPPVRLSAQVDRSKPPTLPPPPALKLPAVQTAVLPNGLTLAVVTLPQAIAFSTTLAGLPPHFGIYAAIWGVLFTALLNPSHVFSGGPNTSIPIKTEATGSARRQPKVDYPVTETRL